MHEIQKKLLALAEHADVNAMSLRAIGDAIDVRHPQQVKYHMEQLQKIKALRSTGKKTLASTLKREAASAPRFTSIPIMGMANCGLPTMLAEEKIDGYLQISGQFLKDHRGPGIFAVRAMGSSMNRASINGKNIVDGDFVLVDREDKNVRSGDYVLSVINGAANIKRLMRDTLHEQIVLMSESTQFIPPIHIHPDDFNDYLLNGKVLDVIKSPKTEELRLEYTHI
ncbi:MAG TPA: S24 family peptidase [Candidatus Paceibacterota bacterium]